MMRSRRCPKCSLRRYSKSFDCGHTNTPPVCIQCCTICRKVRHVPKSERSNPGAPDPGKAAGWAKDHGLAEPGCYRPDIITGPHGTLYTVRRGEKGKERIKDRIGMRGEEEQRLDAVMIKLEAKRRTVERLKGFAQLRDKA